MDLSKVPRPLLVASFVCVSLVLGYGARDHIPGLSRGDNETFEGSNPGKLGSKSIRVIVIDDASEKPIPDAEIILESEGGVDSDTTDDLGVFQIQIPDTDSVRVRISKEGYEPYNQNLNLLSNPDRPKQIKLEPIAP